MMRGCVLWRGGIVDVEVGGLSVDDVVVSVFVDVVGVVISVNVTCLLVVVVIFIHGTFVVGGSVVFVSLLHV